VLHQALGQVNADSADPDRQPRRPMLRHQVKTRMDCSSRDLLVRLAARDAISVGAASRRILRQFLRTQCLELPCDFSNWPLNRERAALKHEVRIWLDPSDFDSLCHIARSRDVALSHVVAFVLHHSLSRQHRSTAI